MRPGRRWPEGVLRQADCSPFGNIGAHMLPGTRRNVEEEVCGNVDAAAMGGGCIFHPDHSIPPTVPCENQLDGLELLEEFGMYCSATVGHLADPQLPPLASPMPVAGPLQPGYDGRHHER